MLPLILVGPRACGLTRKLGQGNLKGISLQLSAWHSGYRQQWLWGRRQQRMLLQSSRSNWMQTARRCYGAFTTKVIGFLPSTETLVLTISIVRLPTTTPAKDMHQQAENTEHRLRELFDPDFFALPRADFQLQAKELGTV